ncbi:Juvenile hormone epoxide hydrolase [Lachnellula suecica]|uniref:Juvenile hormone epoxide hydrolase n=1 Tax=Lachnellula suecica TaxID=602035 RepID=A0A8T9BS96_9HELO|nr:Juvenile hormone epoxide hydrolase [Lachnellula suecica]
MVLLQVPLLGVMLAVLSYALLAPASSLPFNASFGDTPQPFKIDVDPEFIALTRLKASMTRFVDEIDLPPFTEGPTTQNATAIRDYWVNGYDWFEVQEQLNKQFSHFTTTVYTASPSNFTDPVPLHFVHHISNRSDAIPLLFIHGWPGSFMEVTNIISGLTVSSVPTGLVQLDNFPSFPQNAPLKKDRETYTSFQNPPNASLPAFHVVAPSLPGFGFSPAPTKPGMGTREIAHALQSLMLQLNYPKYVVQGGDWGGIILRYIAGDFPSSVLSALSNFWVIQPTADDLARYVAGNATADETVAIEGVQGFFGHVAGYFFQQQLQSLQMAIVASDSPVGNAMWIYEVMFHAVEDYWWTAEEIITWSMMYWIQGPYGGMRLYRESLLEGATIVGGFGSNFPHIEQPVAISQFPADVQYRVPLDWARRLGNVVVRNVHAFGGHFAAVETPDALLGDIREFWGNETLSGLEGVF